MASITNVVNVSLLTGGSLALADNPNVVAIITSEQGNVLSTASRYRVYRESASVAEDFGTASETYAYALTFFGTQPNALNAGGFLVVGYWRGASESVLASAALLTGAQVASTTVISSLQSISDGTLDIDIDGTTESLAGLDFTTSTTLEEMAAIIDAPLVGGTCTINSAGDRFIITSATTGAASLITFATDPATGTFVGAIVGMTTGSGAFLAQGTAADTLTAETKLDAVVELAAVVKYRGAMFIDNPTDVESEALATWAQANDVLMYDVFNEAANLEINATNVVWKIKLAGQSNYRMLYSAAGNRKLAASYMARMHTANFAAENSALTMNLKELNVTAEDYSETVISKAKNVGLDLYTTIKLTPKLLVSGVNLFTDERYNLIAYVDNLQIDVFNLLAGTSTKIAQTQSGIAKIVDACEKTTRQFRRAGVFAAGTWSSPDSFGDRETFEQNILDNGFYWLAGSLADQSQASREAREAPVIQGAVKAAGAVHSSDIIVNFNR